MMNQEPLQSSGPSLQEYFAILRRRKTVFFLAFTLVCALGLFRYLLSKPVYRTTTRMMVQGKSLSLSQLSPVDFLTNPKAMNGGRDVSTQIELLQSKEMLESAFQKAEVPKKADVDLNIKQVRDTDVIEISVEAHNPKYALGIARSLPSIYANYVKGDQKKEISSALTYAEASLKTETDKLNRAGRSLDDFMKQTQTLNLEAEKLDYLQQVGAAEAELRKAQTEVSSRQARLTSLEAARRALPAMLETPTTVSNREHIQKQKDLLETLKSERDRLAVTHKPDHPTMIQAEAAVARQEKAVNNLPQVVTDIRRTPNPALETYDEKIDGVRAELMAGQAAAVDAQAKLNAIKQNMSKYISVQQKHTDLQRAVAQHQSMIELLTKSIAEMQLRKYADFDPVVTIWPAEEVKQVAPRVLRDLLITLLLAIGLAISCALLLEYLDDRINAPEEVRRVLSLPALTYIPMAEGQETLLRTAAHGNRLLESFRVLRSNVRFANVDRSLRSIQVTSTVPGEGKSTVASNMAIAIALDGRRVILVDCDLRRPTLHDKFDLPKQPGITNVLLGELPLEEALQETPHPGLRFLACGPIPPNPTELLVSRSMQELHAALREMADVVIFDSPPCLATADAQVIAEQVDGVLYVMQLGAVKRSAVTEAIELLQRAHAHVLGIVYNKVVSTSGRGGYYGYYYHSSYATEPENGANGAVIKWRPKHNSQQAAEPARHEASEERGVTLVRGVEKETTHRRDEPNGNGTDNKH